LTSQPKLKAALRVPYEVRALDLIGYIGSVCLLAAVAALASVKPANQPFRLSFLLNEEDGLEPHWSVAPGYFLYRDQISATLNRKPLKVETARGETKDDPAFGPNELYHREATAHVDGKDLPELGEILVTYQGCRENTACYSPITKSIDLATFCISDEVLVSDQGCGENKIFHSPITKPE
jgi:thiol:disulfide interchange protein DsbD